jgi:hypothetical protein
MSVAADILSEINERGATVSVEGQTLRLRPRMVLDDDLVARIKQHKPEIIRAVSAKDTPHPIEDKYSRRLQAALANVCRPDYPAGMILWLRDTFPLLYVELIDGLPDEMHRLWSGHAPLKEFDHILDDWMEAHRTACEMFKASEARNSAEPGPEKLNG